MQAVPSLVGTGSAIAAAASGLVFGEATESTSSIYPPSRSRPTVLENERRRHSRVYETPSSRPGTSSVAPVSSRSVERSERHIQPRTPEVSRPPLSRYQRPASSQLSASRTASRRQSFIRQGESAVNTIAETPRDSFSSNSSWIKRLSGRPLSQHGSPRSSIGPDSQSIAVSHGSGAPILSPFPPPVTPNKLVKRTSSIVADESSASRRRSKSHIPSLRRPATSHQRSATLQQFRPTHLGTPSSASNQSLERGIQLPHVGLLPSPFEPERKPRDKIGWVSFFHSRISSASGRSGSRFTEFSPRGVNNRNNLPRRISLKGGDHQRRAHLVKPTMVSEHRVQSDSVPPQDTWEGPQQPQDLPQPVDTPEETTPSKALRRSISLTFSSAGNWVSRTSGSIRRPKRPSSSTNGASRIVSDPVTTSQVGTDGRFDAGDRPVSPSNLIPIQGARPTPSLSGQVSLRQRGLSSPPVSRSPLSTAHIDSRLSSPTGPPLLSPRLNQPSGSSSSSSAVANFRSIRYDRAATLDSSEGDFRDIMSGDDDDTDFKSDTVFDSMRTVASGRPRVLETPVDSLYDESPPGTAGNGKAKRLSIQEILGKDWHGGDRIMEEEESVATPVRTEHRVDEFHLNPDMDTDSPFGMQPSRILLKDRARASIDDDFDDDWARDDDGFTNALSPPSKGSSVNSKSINPNVRMALANISGNGHKDLSAHLGNNDRPLSNLFDWSEPSAHEKADSSGRSPRPRTAYANQESDTRGGRSVSRRGPVPAHIRSQSVPVVHEGTDESTKPNNSKYGTWGISTKTISEDWDDDFEFGGSVGSDRDHGHLFAVPESIQATQPSVKAHSGQIRELSLLVNDLQRLCRRGREMELLDSHNRSLWKEAEGIIALASPDDDSLEAGGNTTASLDLDAFEANDRNNDNFDTESLDKLDALFDGSEPVMSKTAVVRDRPSPQRRSVFSPDDDIFGGNWPLADDNVHSNRSSRPRTPEPRLNRPHDVNGVVRTVVEAMQQRSIADQVHELAHGGKRVHFDTNSLKLLVKRAGDLRDRLSDIIRRADQITQSPAQSPRAERHLESSPAFTKVFDDPASSPPRRIPRSRGSTSMVDDASSDTSPPSGISRRLQLMTVK